jgi:hypothetical protein
MLQQAPSSTPPSQHVPRYLTSLLRNEQGVYAYALPAVGILCFTVHIHCRGLRIVCRINRHHFKPQGTFGGRQPRLCTVIMETDAFLPSYC